MSHRLTALDFAIIHAFNGYMKKIQILFPDPLMRRLREIAALEDRPLSELIRRAVERFTEQTPYRENLNSAQRRLPTFKCGTMLASSSEMKEVIYSRDE